MLGPYATVPYGMVQLGPDNQAAGWMGGYEYSMMNVSGFSHIHAWTMSGLRIMPANQDFTKDDGAPDRPYKGGSAGYHSRIEKETEKAWPGYYSCFLCDASCKAEMTATTRCGFHRYTFDKECDARIILDLLFPAEDQAEILDARIDQVSNTLVEGYANTIVPSTKNMEYKLLSSGTICCRKSKWRVARQIKRNFTPIFTAVLPNKPGAMPMAGIAILSRKSGSCQRERRCMARDLHKNLGDDLDYLACLIDGYRKAERWAELAVNDYAKEATQDGENARIYLKYSIYRHINSYVMDWVKDANAELRDDVKRFPTMVELICHEAERRLNTLRIQASLPVFA
jgi:hypothetical protein